MAPASLCTEVRPGYYVTTAEAGTRVTEYLARDSKDLRVIPAGVVLHIVETKLIGNRIVETNKNRIRGKLAEGGWISIMNTETDFCWAQPCDVR